MTDDYFTQFRKECENILGEVLNEAYGYPTSTTIQLDVPPNPEMGELSSTAPFELAKLSTGKPKEIALRIVQKIKTLLERNTPEKGNLLRDVSVGGLGYINFHVRREKISGLTLEAVARLDSRYGFTRTDSPRKVIVEHTSVNPAGPIHVGTARNSFVGDSLSRILSARGHKVRRHFYIDDVGRQIAVISYGYRLLGKPMPEGKADHWIGLLYGDASCIVEIRKLKSGIAMQSGKGSPDDLDETKRKLTDWEKAADDLRARDPALYSALETGISDDEDPEGSISELNKQYEEHMPETVSLFRSVVGLCLGGFRNTYENVGIGWDSWDWESDHVWSGSVSDAIECLKNTPYFEFFKGAKAIDVDRAARELGIRKKMGIATDHEIPQMILVRSDGTTLYTTRDIAYSLWKLDQADMVINVIGVEQALPQIQLKIALSLLVGPKKADSMIHYAYEIVDLPGYRMSKRRGRYITLDEILEEAVKRAREEVEKRSPQLDAALKEKISIDVGHGAVKYALISVVPTKKVTFTWDKVLNFELNSAPFIQYSHARACSILAKADVRERNPDYDLIREPLEWQLIFCIARFPAVFSEAAEALSPATIAAYANELASRFNSFYATYPVLKAETEALADTRLAVVDAARITMKNALSLLGIGAPTTM